jgi:hypothetical protein
MRRKLACDQLPVKRNAKELAERAQHPDQRATVERTIPRPRPLLLQPSRSQRLHRVRTQVQIPLLTSSSVSLFCDKRLRLSFNFPLD